MKKNLIFILFITVFIIACSNDNMEKSTDNQIVEEVLELDSLSTDLDQTIQSIDQSEQKLKNALEELDD